MARAKHVFSLDIGTRSVVGVIAEMDGDVLVVKHLEQCEHKVRSMLDGQIHDIALVSSVVDRVKKSLEEQVGTKLKDVAVAVAGRALKTV
ncbi:MAG: cell division protein FtsA, partial [Synergistetes bacterium]|nr:cell division protein FtsA [Synergistota bacterium]